MTVAVCTRGVHPELGPCLAAVVEQLAPGDQLLVIVNGAGGAAPPRPPATASDVQVTVVVDPVPGLARARNRAIVEAGGDVVAFLDDDARPEPGWLEALRAAFVALAPQLAAAGGPIRLRWPDDRAPRWYHPDLAAYWSGLDLGGPARVLARGPLPFGANVAFRRAVLASAGGFAADLGRRGDGLAGGEETELLERLRAGGSPIGWVPGAVVEHVVGPDRTRLRWLLRRAFAQGRTDLALRPPTAGPYRETARHLAAATVRGWRVLARELRAPDGDRGAVLARDLARRARAAGRAAGGAR